MNQQTDESKTMEKHEVIRKRLFDLECSIGQLEIFLNEINGQIHNAEAEGVLPAQCLAEFLNQTPDRIEMCRNKVEDIYSGLSKALF